MPERLTQNSEKNEEIEGLAIKVIDAFKKRIAGKTFSFSQIGGEYVDSSVTIIPDRAKTGQALWDPSSPDNVLYGQREGAANSGIITLNNILVTPEAKELISTILNEMKIPTGMQGEVKKQIKKDYPPLH